MRERVSIQRRSSAAAQDDAIGGFTDSWTTQETRWARVIPVAASEASRAGQLEGQVTHEVTLRYVSDIGPADRFLYGSRVLNIVSIRDLEERHRYTVCQCVEVVT